MANRDDKTQVIPFRHVAKSAAMSLLAVLLLAVPAKAQQTTEAEVNPPGNREAFEACLASGSADHICYSRHPHRRPEFEGTEVPRRLTTERCRDQGEEKNIEIIHLCEQEGFTYIWDDFKGGRVDRIVPLVPFGNLLTMTAEGCSSVGASLVSSRTCRKTFPDGVSAAYGATESGLMIKVQEVADGSILHRIVQVADPLNSPTQGDEPPEIIASGLFVFIQGVGGGGFWQPIDIFREDIIEPLEEEINYLARYSRQ